MHTRTRGGDDEKLDALFRAYRDACPAPEPGPDFMPRLWERIEARQRFSFFLGRVAGAFVTAGVAATLAMAAYLYYPRHSTVYYSQSYVEALASQADSGEYFEPLQYESTDPAGKL